MAGKRNTIFYSTMLVIAFAMTYAGTQATAAGTYHQVTMRGSIIEVNGSEVYLCIGHKDGAKVGQRFDVFKMVRVAGTRAGQSGAPSSSYNKLKTGTVEIVEIVDEHFARGKIVTGSANKDYIVELNYPNCTCK